MSCFTTGGPAKGHGANKLPPTRRVQERSKGDSTCPTTSQNPSLWHPSWLSDVCTTRKDSESEWLAKDNPETNPLTIKPKTGRAVLLGSLTPLLSAWVPLPDKVSALSTCLLRQIFSKCETEAHSCGSGVGPPTYNSFRKKDCKRLVGPEYLLSFWPFPNSSSCW